MNAKTKRENLTVLKMTQKERNNVFHEFCNYSLIVMKFYDPSRGIVVRTLLLFYTPIAPVCQSMTDGMVFYVYGTLEPWQETSWEIYCLMNIL